MRLPTPVLAFAALVVATTLTAGVANAAGYTISVRPTPIQIGTPRTVTTTVGAACPDITVVDFSFIYDGPNISYVYIDALDPSCYAPARVTLSNAASTFSLVYSIGNLTEGLGSLTPVGGTGWNTTPGTGNGAISQMKIEINPS